MNYIKSGSDVVHLSIHTIYHFYYKRQQIHLQLSENSKIKMAIDALVDYFNERFAWWAAKPGCKKLSLEVDWNSQENWASLHNLQC